MILKLQKDSSFVMGTVTNDDGRFKLISLSSGKYIIELSTIGFTTYKQAITIGALSSFLDLGIYELQDDTRLLKQVTITAGQQDRISNKMDKKTFYLSNNLTQSGGSVLQAMQNLPGVTIQDGKVQLRGNDKVAVLIDGKQNAVTRFGTQTGLDNIPASAIERIEIINIQICNSSQD